MEVVLVALVILGGWVSIAIVTGVIARERGRSAFGWLLLGLAFSVLALVLVLALPRLDEYPEGYGTCPKCFGRVDLRASICPHCRSPKPGT